MRDRVAALLLALALALPAAAPADIVLDAVPGGLTEIPLVPLEGPQPTAYFGQRRLLVTERASSWVGLVGLPLSLVPGGYLIRINPDAGEDMEVRRFTVFPRRTGSAGAVTLPGPAYEPDQSALAWRPELDAGLPLAAPVRYPPRPVFGRHWQSPGSAGQYTDFVVFDLLTDSAVRSPGAGLVAEVAQTDAGTYLLLDHGMGLFTRLGPLTETRRSAGDRVEAGAVVARVYLAEDEATRVLYFSVYLGGIAVNPALVTDVKH